MLKDGASFRRSRLAVFFEHCDICCFSEKVTADLIHPLVFDGMYCSIFSLYALSNDRQDQKFGTSIKLLNQRSDFALMNFYDVEPMFNPSPDSNQVHTTHFRFLR